MAYIVGSPKLIYRLFRWMELELGFQLWTLKGRRNWIADAHRDGKRLIVRADEMLTAFVELQRAIHEFAMSLIL